MPPIPDVGCKGLCVQSCAFAPLFPVEETAISALAGKPVGPVMADDAGGACPMLQDGRCSIYEHRPVVCRLFGAVPKMRCPHGCQPTLSDVQGHAVMQAVKDLAEDRGSNRRCGSCNGQGRLGTSSVHKPMCPVCRGSGREPYREGENDR